MRDYKKEKESSEAEPAPADTPIGGDLRAATLHRRMQQRNARRSEAPTPSAGSDPMRAPPDEHAAPQADALVGAAGAGGGAGERLPAKLQRKFETSLQRDLSGVRVHTGASSQAASNAVGARAYTVGNDIHFNRGEYDPSSAAGENLLAHEVAHTVQQSASGAIGPQHKLQVGDPNDAAEHKADAAADAMVVGRPASAGESSGPVIRRRSLFTPKGETDVKFQVPVGLILDCGDEINWAGRIEQPADLAGLCSAYQDRESAQETLDEVKRAMRDKSLGGKPDATTVDKVTQAAADFRKAVLAFQGHCDLSAKVARSAPMAPPEGAPEGTVNPEHYTKLADSLTRISRQQDDLLLAADQDRRTAMQAGADFLKGRGTGLPFAWEIVSAPTKDFVDAWLQYYHFEFDKQAATSEQCMFNGQGSDVKEVTELFMVDAVKAGWTFDRDMVQGEISTVLNAEQTEKIGEAKGEKKKEDKSPEIAVSLQANWTTHQELKDKKKTSTDPTTWQVGGQLTVKLEGIGVGFEASLQGNVSFIKHQNDVTGMTVDGVTFTGGQVAGQLAWVKPFFDDMVKTSFFVQMAAGFDGSKESENPPATGFTMKPEAMVQAAGGLQALLAIPDTGKHLSLGLQGQGSLTSTLPTPTADLQGAVFLQYSS